MSNKPVYLHFLDRELRTAENASFTDEQAFSFAFIASLLSDLPVYAGVSIIYESVEDFPKTIDLIYGLEKNSCARFLSSSESEEEFMVSREILYKRDKERYPMYFSPDKTLWGTDPVVLSDSTTNIIASTILGNCAGYKTGHPLVSRKNDIVNRLCSREEAAVTLSLFKDVLKTREERFNLSIDISKAYTKRYLDYFNGTVLHGIPNLARYSSFCESTFPDYDFPIYEFLLSYIIWGCFSRIKDLSVETAIQLLIKLKSEKSFYRSILFRLRGIVRGLMRVVGLSDMSKCRCYIIDTLKGASARIKPMDNEMKNLEEQMNYRLLMLEDAIKKEIPFFAVDVEKRQSIVLMVATKTELNRLVDFYACSERHKVMGNHTFWYAGQFGEYDVQIVKTEMGSRGQSGSILTINDVIEVMKPVYIIMLGIGFGLKQDKEKLTDVMVANKLIDYEPARVGEECGIHRGDEIPASYVLIDRFNAATTTCKDFGIHIGPVVTGDKLVDSEKFVNQLKSDFPDAIGGEMEGEGLLASAFRGKIDWILVKGICDWGYNKNDEFQAKAADNAIFLVDKVLKDYL